MADIWDNKKRSEVMSKIRSSENKDTELFLIKIFREYKITGWRRKQPIYGKPDFIFRKAKLVVFVDGCFWHGCPKHYKLPGSNKKFWLKKFTANKNRDLHVSRTLKNQGWRVIRIWEHDLKYPKRVVTRIKRYLVIL